MRTKQDEYLIEDVLTSLPLCELEGTLDDAADRLQRLKEEYGGDAKLDLQYSRYDDGPKYALVRIRPENDAEKKKRQEQEERNRAYRRQQYENLKKEFEGGAT